MEGKTDAEKRLMDGYRKRAIFVVHGIGSHQGGSTSVLLRGGFEDALDKIKQLTDVERTNDASWLNMPATYIKEGYWGDYGNFQRCFPDLWKKMEASPRSFFSHLWTKRTSSALGTAWWFAKKAFFLPFEILLNWSDSPGLWKSLSQIPYRVFRFFVYLAVMLVAWFTLLLLVLLPGGRKILSDMLVDVRVYLEPKGQVEFAIVQRIDRQVRDLFLQLLGLDWEFNDLPDPDDLEADTERTNGLTKIKIGDALHTFEEVTWVSHSLGTVVSYNVISDLLFRCKELRQKAGVDDKDGLSKKADRVEKGLYRFYTMGSPLRKIIWMFPGVLREWPHQYLAERILKTKGEQWWVNFRHIWDPVSGYLPGSRFFPELTDVHSSKLLTLPGYTHISYWHTSALCQYILAQTHPETPGAPQVHLPKWPQWTLVKVAWHLSMLVFFAAVCWVLLRVAYSLAGFGAAYLPALWNWIADCRACQYASHSAWDLLVAIWHWLARLIG
jgi:hypothetical protein